MSGTIYRPLVVREADITIANRIAAQLGFQTDNGELAVQYLSKVNPHLVIKASLDLGIHFRPCVEEIFDGIDPLVTNYPANMSIRRSIPIMMGYCDSETMFRYHDMETFSRNIFDLYINSTYDLGEDVDVGNIVKQFYLGDKEISIEVLNEISAFDSDFNFVHPIQTRIKELISHGSTVYHYMFTYSGDRNFVKKRCKNKLKGACHADDIAFLFDISYEGKPTDRDQLMINRMTSLYANFAKFGNPTPKISKLLPVEWLPVKQDLSCFVIGDELSHSMRPFYDRMSFWDLFCEFYKNKLKYSKVNKTKTTK
ncbi:unnamed protein product [Danaus chrysippus]|uniref:(African queen) hypothetical protein n=1 Tax=Danaus chrysippus TaxID=151541 RepID=A0A8J2QPI7_9NEOP|nr:unnamed protein product [Danaus chrysippus]